MSQAYMSYIYIYIYIYYTRSRGDLIQVYKHAHTYDSVDADYVNLDH